MNILAFDIETIPDVATGRKLYDLEGLSDKDTAQAMFARRREQTGDSDFLRHHLIPARPYGETGSDDQSFRWNNYLSRFHERHTDLMDVLAGYQPRASAPLDEMAQLLGFPGKLRRHGRGGWDQYLAGQIGEIRD